MTLDSAITYYEEIAKDCRRKADIERNDYMDMRDSASEAEQLASWLNELKLLRGRIDAQPERIKGRWILAKEQRQEDTENGNYMYNCSNCDCGDLHSKAVKVSYCWNCGADMRGGQDG